jgi:hypothetical protein
VLVEGTAAPRIRGSRVPVGRSNVRAAADILSELIHRLSRPDPLPVKGIAMVCTLLDDGAGPIYYPGAPEELRRALERTLAALEPPTAP